MCMCVLRVQFIPASNMDKYLRPALPRATFHVMEDADHFQFLNKCVSMCCCDVDSLKEIFVRLMVWRCHFRTRQPCVIRPLPVSVSFQRRVAAYVFFAK